MGIFTKNIQKVSKGHLVIKYYSHKKQVLFTFSYL